MLDADFIHDLKLLCSEHNVLLEGELRALSHIRFKNQKVRKAAQVERGGLTDRTGPFVIFTVDEIPYENHNEIKKSQLAILNKEKVMGDGVISPVNRKAYTSRHSWDEHLKENGCVQIGNDTPVRPRELQGDFNCREALTKATREVFEKRGLK